MRLKVFQKGKQLENLIATRYPKLSPVDFLINNFDLARSSAETYLRKGEILYIVFRKRFNKVFSNDYDVLIKYRESQVDLEKRLKFVSIK